MSTLSPSEHAEPPPVGEGARPVRLFCLALDTYPPFRVDVVELMDKALAARGYAIDWAMPRAEPGPGGHHRTAAGQVYVLKGRPRRGALPAVLWSWLRYVGHVGEQILRGRYDVVQARDQPVLALWAWLWARLAGARFTYWMSYPIAESRCFRAADPGEAMGAWKRRWLALYGRLSVFVQYRLVLPASDHVFVQSDRMKADVAARGIAARKITAVPMGVLLEEIDEARVPDIADPAPGRPMIVHLGTLIRVRRPDFLIDVLADVCRVVPEALLVLIGDAPEADMAALKAHAARMGMAEHVRFMGSLPRPRALALARRAAVCVSLFPPHPLNDSTTPTKLIEYLALGRPVVVNTHPDQSAVVAESGAGLAVPFERAAFAGALIELLQAPEAAEVMGARGPDYVRRRRAYGLLAARVDAAYRTIIR